MSELPKGWIEVKLPQVAEINFGQSPSSSTYNISGKGLPFFQGKAEFGDIYPSVKKYCSEPTKIAEPGDILLSVRAPVGPTNVCLEKCGIGRGLVAIRSKGEIPNRFLFYYFRNIEKWLSAQGTGSTFTAISRNDLIDIDVPLAPLPEQRRIAAKLESILEKVTASKQRLEKILKLLKRFRKSVLAAACSGKLTADWREKNEVEDWIETNLGRLMKVDPQNGLYKPMTDYGTGTPIVRIDNFYDGVIDSTKNLKLVRLTKKEKRIYKLNIDEVLINRVNSIKFLGKCGLVRELRADCVFESNMMRIVFNKDFILPAYAIYFLQSIQGIKELQKNAKHAVNQASINQKDVKDVNILLPLIVEQDEIVRRVEQLFTVADKIEERYTKANKQVEKLTQSILAKTFRGELVPQDPNDEPASELLVRIKRERDLAQTKTFTQKKTESKRAKRKKSK